MVMIDFHRIPEKMTGRHAENPLWVLVHVVSYKVYPALAGLVLSHLRPRESSSSVFLYDERADSWREMPGMAVPRWCGGAVPCVL